jgi:hypothetical protein
MSRLTDSNKEIPLLINERYWLDIYFKLKEYEELEEQGLLLKLPCKVGDTVYVIDKRYTKCSLYDEEYSESSCWNCDKECDSKMYYVVVKRYVGTLEWIVSRLKKFGKTVFLTKEEAEQELKRLESAE